MHLIITCMLTLHTQHLVFSGLMTILIDLHASLLLYQSLYDVTNPIGSNLISVPVLTNALGCNLIPVFGLTDSLGCRLISALVLTNHLKCHIIFLILLCLALPFFNSPWLFLFSIVYACVYYLCVIVTVLKYIRMCTNYHKISHCQSIVRGFK